MTTSPLSDAEIEELKKDVKYRANGWQFDLFRMVDAVPLLISEIEAARRSESATGYAMWDAAVRECAKVARNSAKWKRQRPERPFPANRMHLEASEAIEVAILSIMTPKGSSRQDGTSPPRPQPTVANDTAGAEQIEAAAAALGLELGPPDSQSGGWSVSYRQNVRWPQDYSERERIKLRNAATVALEAVRRFTQPQNAAAGDK